MAAHFGGLVLTTGNAVALVELCGWMQRVVGDFFELVGEFKRALSGALRSKTPKSN